MSVGLLLFTIASGLVINELSDLSPWLAEKIARWSARLRCADPAVAQDLSDELAAYITDRPGKLLKLLASFGFLGAALLRRARRSQAVSSRPGTWAEQFNGFCIWATIEAVLVTHWSPATWLLMIMGNGMMVMHSRVMKCRANGRLSRIERVYKFCLLLLFLPAAYITFIAITVYSTVRLVEGHQSWAIWLLLIFNAMMLTVPVNWVMMARIQSRMTQAANTAQHTGGL
jgi:hypothetical protein